MNGNAAQTRAQIIDAAVDIISLNGFSALTAATLIQRAKISKGGLYHHFKQMDDVAYAALMQLSDNYLQLIDKSPCRSSSELLTKLEADWKSLTVKHHKVAKGICCFYQQAIHHERYRSVLNEMSTELNLLRQKQLTDISPEISRQLKEELSQTIDAIFTGALLHHSAGLSTEQLKPLGWGHLKQVITSTFNSNEVDMTVLNATDPRYCGLSA